MKIACTLFFILIIALSFGQREGPVFVPETNKKGKVGLFYRSELVLDHKYDVIVANKNMAVAGVGSSFTVYSDSMKIKHQGNYDELVNLFGAWVVFRKDDQITVIDIRRGEIENFVEESGAENCAVMRNRFGKTGLVDASGKVIADFIYDDVDLQNQFDSNGFYFMQKGDSSHVINANGEIVERLKYDAIWPMKTRNCFAYRLGRKWGIFSFDGTVKLPLVNLKNEKDITANKTPLVANVLRYYVITKKDEDGRTMYALIDNNGEIKYDFTYNDISYTCKSLHCDSEDYFCIRKEGDQCIVEDAELNEMGRLEADKFIGQQFARPFKPNWVFLKDNSIREFNLQTYKEAEDLYYKKSKNKRIIKTADQYYGLLDTNLNIVLPFVYRNIEQLYENDFTYLIVKGENPADGPAWAEGLINIDGSTLLSPQFKSIKAVHVAGFQHLLMVTNFEERGALAMISKDGSSVKMLSGFILNDNFHISHEEKGLGFYTQEGDKLICDDKGNVFIRKKE